MITIIERVERILESNQQKSDRIAIDLQIAREAAQEICEAFVIGYSYKEAVAEVIYRHMKGGL